MELRVLRYFITVAEELHFGRAAEKLHLSQPSLSQQICQLEQELGVLLLERTKRKTKLTYAGKVFFEGSKKIIDLVNQTVEKTRQAARKESNNLTIGSTGLLLNNIVSTTIRTFLDLYPLAQINVFEMTSIEQLKALNEGKIDLGFLRTVFIKTQLKDNDIHFNYKIVYKEPMVVALPDKHPLAGSSEISINQLVNESFIMLPLQSSSCHEDLTLMLCAQAGFKPKKVVHEAITTKTIASLVAAGLGIAIVPISISHYQKTGVVYLPIKDSDIQLETALIWQKENKSKILEKFINVLFDTIEDKSCSSELPCNNLIRPVYHL